MKTTIRNLRKVIREASGISDDQFWADAESQGGVIGWKEARLHMPADIASGFEKKVVGEYEMNLAEFEFSYGPITYDRDDMDPPDFADFEDDEVDENSYYQAFNHKVDELWAANAQGEWMLYNY